MSEENGTTLYERWTPAPLGTLKRQMYDAHQKPLGDPVYQASGCYAETYFGATPEEARAKADASYRSSVLPPAEERQHG